ncbi:unnamed protein product [Auanema sp. JU1783]|nr:unnamed protein product [Auanema sp. JU1783]
MVEQTYKFGGGIELPSFRSLSDFLLIKSRYEHPSYSNLSNWQNRIIANLLYYQTNYFFSFFCLFIFEIFFCGQDTVFGFFTILLSLAMTFFMLTTDPYYSQLRRDHKYIAWGAVIVTIQIFLMFLSSFLKFLFCVLLPIFMILCHASIRLRSIMNKINQQTEKFGLKTTVMGKLLDMSGLEVRS